MSKIRFVNVLLLLLSVQFLSAQSKHNFTLNGNLSNNTSPKVFLELFGEKPVLLDSAAINKKGSFEIKTTLPGINFYRLKFTEQNFMIIVLQPGDKMKFEADALNLVKTAKVSGAPHTELILKIDKELASYQQKLDSIEDVYMLNRSSENNKNLDPILVDEYKKTEGEQKAYLKNMILQNSTSLATLFFIDKIDIGQDFPVYKKLDSTLFANYPDIVFVKELHKKIEAEKLLAVGNAAPEISLPSPEGDSVNLSSLRGKIVLIDFWASWCGPCRKESPFMVKMYNTYKDKGFEIYGVSLDKSREGWLAAIQKDGLNWVHVSDLKFWQSAAAAAYRVTTIPYTVLLDKQGVIIAKGLRGENLESKLSEIFGH